MATKVGEFFIELAIDAASGNLSVKQLVGALGELDVVSVGTVGVLSKVAQTLYNLASAATGTAVELTALAAITGEDPKIVQQWEKAAERVVHHTGSITKAINAVHDMNKRISVGGPAPAALTGLLGLSPYKVDDKGNTVTKGAMEYMKELAANGSTYRSRSRDVQQQGLAELFGSGSDDMFRIIQTMIAGKFKPEQISGMNDKQVRDLNRVDEGRIKVGQQMTDIFQHLLVSGDHVAEMFDNISKHLDTLDKWLESKSGKQAVNGAAAAVGAFFHPRNYNPFLLGKDMGAAAGASLFGGSPVKTPAIVPELKMSDFKGKLDINLMRDGKPLGGKEVFVDRAGTMRDFWQVTDQLGNTP